MAYKGPCTPPVAERTHQANRVTELVQILKGIQDRLGWITGHGEQNQKILIRSASFLAY